MGTLTVRLPSERMMASFETMEPRFLRTASFTRSLCRSWSMIPLRCKDQSLRWIVPEMFESFVIPNSLPSSRRRCAAH